MSDLNNRRGKIIFTRTLIYNNLDILADVFKGAVVVQTEPNVMFDTVCYYLHHPEFREVSPGEVIPEYDVMVDQDDDTGIIKSISFVEKSSETVLVME